VKVRESKPSCKVGRGKEETLVITRSFQAGEHPEPFHGWADPEAIYNLFDFKNYVMKIML
jgi:hypothetical protein